MAKIDMKKEMKPLYQASANAVVQVEVPALKYLMVDGKGDPNKSPLYRQALEALFSVSYAAKFLLKKGPQAMDYGVMPLEGLWSDTQRFETFTEGTCAQTLHIGPFTEEGPTIERLHTFIDAQSARRGKHHEIYLSDIRRADPKRWKTIIRRPM